MRPPIPRPELRSKCPGSSDIKKFLAIGRGNVSVVEALAQSMNLNILEFGCGCGMNLRHWNRPGIYGLDFDEKNIEWCGRNLPLIKTSLIANGPCIFSEDFFDIIYVPEFIANCNEIDQDTWLCEMKRVLKPGGYLLVFIRSQRECLLNLKENERVRYEAGDLVVINQALSRTAQCKACHPESYVRTHFGKILPVIDIIPSNLYREGDTSVYIKSIVMMRKIG